MEWVTSHKVILESPSESSFLVQAKRDRLAVKITVAVRKSDIYFLITFKNNLLYKCFCCYSIIFQYFGYIKYNKYVVTKW